MKCRELMKSGIEAFREDDPVQVIALRMRDVGTSFVPICDVAGVPRGTVTDHDIVTTVCADDRRASEVLAGDVMEVGAPACFESDDLDRAEDLMDETHQPRVLVCEERTRRLVGVITLADVFRAQEASRAAATGRKVVERDALA